MKGGSYTDRASTPPERRRLALVNHQKVSRHNVQYLIPALCRQPWQSVSGTDGDHCPHGVYVHSSNSESSFILEPKVLDC